MPASRSRSADASGAETTGLDAMTKSARELADAGENLARRRTAAPHALGRAVPDPGDTRDRRFIFDGRIPRQLVRFWPCCRPPWPLPWPVIVP